MIPFGFAVNRHFCWHFEYAAFRTTKEVFSLLPGLWRIRKQDLIPTFITILTKSVGAYIFLHLFLCIFPFLSKPSICEWDWLGFAHHMAASNSSCTGYQILCLLVPGSVKCRSMNQCTKKKSRCLKERRSIVNKELAPAPKPS